MDEVAKTTGITAHKIRYLEKTDSGFIVTKIRNRLYFTQENIRYIEKKYDRLPEKIRKSFNINTHTAILNSIDLLIQKLKQL